MCVGGGGKARWWRKSICRMPLVRSHRRLYKYMCCGAGDTFFRSRLKKMHRLRFLAIPHKFRFVGHNNFCKQFLFKFINLAIIYQNRKNMYEHFFKWKNYGIFLYFSKHFLFKSVRKKREKKSAGVKSGPAQQYCRLKLERKKYKIPNRCLISVCKIVQFRWGDIFNNYIINCK